MTMPADKPVHSSKGNQLKWKSENLWYKFDSLGYEGASEFLISEILRHSNIENFERYQLAEQQCHGRRLRGCVSEDFLQKGRIITAHRLFLINYGRLVDEVIGGQPGSDRIEDFVDRMEAMTGIRNFGASPVRKSD